jgi:hypothetical protein
VFGGEAEILPEQLTQRDVREEIAAPSTGLFQRVGASGLVGVQHRKLALSQVDLGNVEDPHVQRLSLHVLGRGVADGLRYRRGS